MLQEYVGLVDDAELRISLAQKHKCHDIIINVRHVYLYLLSDWLIGLEGGAYVNPVMS